MILSDIAIIEVFEIFLLHLNLIRLTGCYIDVPSDFKVAEDILQYLWRTQSGTDKAVILVGNKSDLVRTRAVPIVGM